MTCGWTCASCTRALCNNHPKPEDSAYPLWMGLPLETKLTRAQLAERADECLGVKRKPAERSAALAAAPRHAHPRGQAA